MLTNIGSFDMDACLPIFLTSSFLLAHLSRRPSEKSPSTISKIFFSETARPIKLKFYVEPPWVVAFTFCSQYLGHMTKMAATPIYGKNRSKIFFSLNTFKSRLNKHWSRHPYKFTAPCYEPGQTTGLTWNTHQNAPEEVR